MPDAPISHKSEPEGNSEPEKTFAISSEIRKNILGQLIYQIAVLSAISFCSKKVLLYSIYGNEMLF
jgi:hypothetical protein